MKHRSDLKGFTVDSLGLTVEHAVEFPANGTFAAYYSAERFLKELGYSMGSMECSEPIGISLEYDHISKWNNMSQNEHLLLDGIIVSKDFRECSVMVYFFKPPNF